MLIVRKEISGGKSAISTDDIMLNVLQSRSELQKFHELKTIFYDVDFVCGMLERGGNEMMSE